MKTAIIHGNIITPFRIIEDANLIFEDGKILSVTKDNDFIADKYLDANHHYVSPGFIDIHTHGAGGYDFMDGTTDAIVHVCQTHMMHGTTAICPTTLTSTDNELFHFFGSYREAKQRKDLPELLGIHLEGPYFSKEQRGAQDLKYLKIPAEDDYRRILDASDDIVRMSLAPELPGAYDLLEELKKRDILAAIGHSDATYEVVIEAWERGFSHITHLYSGMSTIKRINAFRHLGVIESAYLIDGMTVEIIADGKHLPPELLRLIVKLKPIEDICLITDSMRGAGMPDGTETFLGSITNGQKCYIKNGVAMLPDESAFAGSVCTADRCVRTMYKLAGVSITDAVRMMTYNPAKVMGIQKRKGVLAKGYDADIVIFDQDVNVKAVIVNGNLLFKK